MRPQVHRRRIAAVALLVAVLGLVRPPETSGQGVSELAGLALLLQQLRQNLDQVVGTVDAATANRIRQVEIALDGTLNKVNDVIKNGYNAANTTREKLFKQVFDVMSRADREIQATNRLLFLSVNATLVQIATLLDSMPLVTVPNYLFAIDPRRAKPNQTDHLVSVYGYFPDATTARPAYVTLGGKRYNLDRYENYRLGFTIPDAYYQTEQTFVDFMITVNRGFLHPDVKWKNRIYVEKAKPFSFTISSMKSNPAKRVQVSPPAELVERADSSRTTNIQTLTSADVFSRLIADGSKFDIPSARFDDVRWRVSAGNRPCDCCDSSSGTLNYWNANQLAFSLNAPTCGSKSCSTFYWCGGGGTNAEIYIRPLFSVDRSDVAAEVSGLGYNVQLARDTFGRYAVDDTWRSVTVDGRFKDGDDVNDRSALVTYGVPVATTDLWSARVENGKDLVVETRMEFMSSTSLSLSEDKAGVTPLPSVPKTVAVPQTMPFWVYSDHASATNHFFPTGWTALQPNPTVNDEDSASPHGGSTAIKLTFSKLSEVPPRLYWRNGPANWGEDSNAGFDLTKAKRLSFWAKGAKGGEILSEVGVGGIGLQGGKPYPDSGHAQVKNLVMTTTWQHYTIDLKGVDLGFVIGGFYLEFSAANPTSSVVLLDDIVFEGE